MTPDLPTLAAQAAALFAGLHTLADAGGEEGRIADEVLGEYGRALENTAALLDLRLTGLREDPPEPVVPLDCRIRRRAA